MNGMNTAGHTAPVLYCSCESNFLPRRSNRYRLSVRQQTEREPVDPHEGDARERFRDLFQVYYDGWGGSEEWWGERGTCPKRAGQRGG